jgi:S-adenosylmethionine:tRNA ribosyltransferase-isomerase
LIMDLAALDYELDPALIAQQPLPARDGARLLVVARGQGVCAHAAVRELGDWLRPGDLLVVNDAEVTPARLHGRRLTGGTVEVLLTEPLDDAGAWRCLARRARRLRHGERLHFAPDLDGIWEGEAGGPYRRIRLAATGNLTDVLRARAELPLPPYIRRPTGPLPEDRLRYQTVFARVPGAVAAPTAGLHFTPELLETLAERGIAHVAVTLLVGPATFLPARGTAMGALRVDTERYTISEATAEAIRAARAAGRRVVAVGTTTVRALESAACADGSVQAGHYRTALVITPGYQFRIVDALLTNLHLPQSSLLALVGAFAGIEPTRAAYRVASRAEYRFYSYGDAMLIQ